MRATTNFRRNLWRLQLDDGPVKKQRRLIDRQCRNPPPTSRTSVNPVYETTRQGSNPPQHQPERVQKLSSRTCVPCIQGKQHRTPFPTSTTKVTVPSERVHADLAGPMPVRSFSNKRYMMTIWNETTSFLWSYPIDRKSEAYEVNVQWQEQVERGTGKKVKQDCSNG
jgi:hypothetical protein